MEMEEEEGRGCALCLYFKLHKRAEGCYNCNHVDSREQKRRRESLKERKVTAGQVSERASESQGEKWSSTKKKKLDQTNPLALPVEQRQRGTAKTLWINVHHWKRKKERKKEGRKENDDEVYLEELLRD